MFLLPRLLKREKRSAIVNMASRAAFNYRGGQPLYCATKAYNYSLSQCMSDAYGDKIDVLTVHPCSINTALNPGTDRPYTILP